MAQKEDSVRLVVKHGKSVGKRYPLKGEPVTLGSDPNSGIVVQGAYVSPEHAIVARRDDGLWMVTNKSVNRTLVNQVPVDTRLLESGDQIQVGAESLYEFEIVKKKDKKERKKKEEADKERTGVLKRPALAIAGGAYLLLMFGVVVYLSALDTETEDITLSAQQAEEVLADSRSFMTSQEFTADAPRVQPVALDREYPETAADYYRLMLVLGGGDPDGVVSSEELVDEILRHARDHLFRAWHFEGQGRWSAAIAQYQEITAMIPNIRVPLTQFATYRINQLQPLAEN